MATNGENKALFLTVLPFIFHHISRKKNKRPRLITTHMNTHGACPQHTMKHKHWGFNNNSNTSMQLNQLQLIIKNIQKALMLEGWVDHRLLGIMRSAHVTNLFPAIRHFYCFLKMCSNRTVYMVIKTIYCGSYADLCLIPVIATVRAGRIKHKWERDFSYFFKMQAFEYFIIHILN